MGTGQSQYFWARKQWTGAKVSKKTTTKIDIMKLSQIDLRTTYQSVYSEKFNPESWVIPEMYWSFLRDYSTPSVEKINIHLSDDWENSQSEQMKVKGFKEAFVDLDFSKYFSLDKYERKKMQLEAVHKGMMQIAGDEKWDTDPLLDAYNQCLERNLEYHFDVGKPKSSPDRKHKMGFWCNWDLDVFELYWVLLDRQNRELKRKKLIAKPSYEGEFVYYVKWKWISETAVVLEDRYKHGKNESWKIDLVD